MRRIAFVALLVAVAVASWVVFQRDTAVQRDTPVGTTDEAPLARAAAELANVDNSARNDAAQVVRPESVVDDAPAATSGGASFRVVDPLGSPLADVVIALGGAVTTVSDSTGLVAADFVRVDESPRAGAAHMVLATGLARLPGRERGPIVIVAPARSVLVCVVDTNGALVPDASVVARRTNPLALFPVPVDLEFVAQDSRAHRHEQDGATHRFIALRSDRPQTLQAEDEGRRGVVRVDAFTDAPIEIVLEPIPADDTTRLTIRGTVFASPGEPAKGASVFVGSPDSAVETDAAGRFELVHTVRGLPVDQRDSADAAALAQRLVARHREHGLAYANDFEARVVEHWPSDPPDFEIVLPGANGALRGRLVDALGEGLSGWTVGVFDPTPVGPDLSSNGFMEVRETRTDRGGRFVFAMVDHTREYQLVFTERKTRETFRAGPFAPGPTEHVVTLDDSVFVRDVRGTLRGLSGEPLPDVELHLEVDTFSMSAQDGTVSSSETFGTTTTDAAGRFTFARVPRHGANVRVVSNSERRFDEKALWLDPTALPVELVVARLVPFVPVVAEGFANDTRLIAFDAAGARVQLWMFTAGGGTTSTDAIGLAYLDASVRWVSESAVEFALCTRDAATREQITIARMPLPRWSGSAAEPVRVEFVR